MSKTGRPLKYKTPDELQKAIDDYFTTTDTVTICGLALHLGFAQRKSLLDYEVREGFCNIIKKAKLRVEQSYETRLMSNHTVGAIFVLKNLGWSDKREHEISGKDGQPIPISITGSDGGE